MTAQAPAVREGRALDERIAALIDRADRLYRGGEETETIRAALANDFEQLALALFEYQYRYSEPYRRLCQARSRTPDNVASWRQIPLIPIGAFRRFTLSCVPEGEAERVFESSGTTSSSRARHHLADSGVYDRALVTSFRAYMLPEQESMPLWILFPAPEEMPASSLAYFFGRLRRQVGAAGSAHFMKDGRLEAERLAERLRAAEREGRPICLAGASFSFVHFFDACVREGWRFRLPAGSRMVDTGGFKGRSREVSAGQMRKWAEELLGIEPAFAVNYYGMSELCSQHYDAALRRRALGLAPAEAGVKESPPWTRVRILDPETLEDAPEGSEGLIAHYDMANRNSAFAILSEDVGRRTADGFVMLGRAQGSVARGCSLAVDEMLSGAGREA